MSRYVNLLQLRGTERHSLGELLEKTLRCMYLCYQRKAAYGPGLADLLNTLLIRLIFGDLYLIQYGYMACSTATAYRTQVNDIISSNDIF